MLGYPEAALTDVDQVVKGAREIGHAASLLHALSATSVPCLLVGNYASVNAQTDEAIGIASRIGEVFWRAMGATVQGYVFALTGKASEAVHQITSGIAVRRSLGGTVWLPKGLSYLAKACAGYRAIIALTEVLAEGIARRGRLARARATIKKHIAMRAIFVWSKLLLRIGRRCKKLVVSTSNPG
jgi:hypothetical protein